MHPLFQLLDDYGTQGTSRGHSHSIRTFSPKFDVREHQESYELQGELPGIEQKDIHITFADPHTLVVKGRVERDYSSDGSHDPQGRITGEVTDSSHTNHKATVEDDPSESGRDAKKNDEVAKSSEQHGHQGKQQKKAPKYWVSERSIGEFHRAFTFPSLVDQDGVKASLKNGILSVIIPKSTHHEGKRIMVE
ncbi:hypothetical protein MMC21_007450 [Puttea exsequens]|nr:hypothetical protein [Puttea exsequens]